MREGHVLLGKRAVTTTTWEEGKGEEESVCAGEGI